MHLMLLISVGLFLSGIQVAAHHPASMEIALEMQRENQPVFEVPCPVLNGSMSITSVPCVGYYGQAIFLGSITGGVEPVMLDWDYVLTPQNDDYGADENSIGLFGVVHGDYYLIATDAVGCADTMLFTIPLFPSPTYSVNRSNQNCLGELGSISLSNVNAPAFQKVYDWDFAGTPENDDYGAPPATSDPRDISGLVAGDYYFDFMMVYSEDVICHNYDTISVLGENQWDGSDSDAWQNADNWSCTTVPDHRTVVNIPTGMPHYPVITIQAICCELEMKQGASVNITPVGSLSVVRAHY